MEYEQNTESISGPPPYKGLEILRELESLVPFEALVFDCDGTLADTTAVHEGAWVAAFAEQGLKMTSAWYRDRLSLSAEGLVEAMCANQDGISREKIYRTRARSYLENLVGISELSAAGVARVYAGSVPLAVASSGDRTLVVPTLEALSIAGLFEAVVTAEDVVRTKPAPDLYRRAAAELGVACQTCVAFEDTPGGLASAEAAGMKVIDVRRYRSTRFDARPTSSEVGHR